MEKKKSFRRRLLRWFEENRRNFPWRESGDPYAVLMAEMMLRRTKASQAAPVYERFIREHPAPEDLYQADPAKLHAQLASLGLEWRIAQFEQLAHDLVEQFDGQVPESREELMSLTGVSDYLADAVLVFAFGHPRAVIDANVARVLARYFGLREHAEARRDRQIREVADQLLDRQRPRDYNFALLDLAAGVCTSQRPKHELCPLRRTCFRAKAERVLGSQAPAREGPSGPSPR